MTFLFSEPPIASENFVQKRYDLDDDALLDQLVTLSKWNRRIPNEFLSAEVNNVRSELDKVDAAWDEANAECNRVAWGGAELDKARAELDKANIEWIEAYAGWIKASAEWLSQTDLPALLNKLTPENTWNGKNIGWKK